MKHKIIRTYYAAIAIDKVGQASLESFPASDAPSWIWGESQASMTENKEIADSDIEQSGRLPQSLRNRTRSRAGQLGAVLRGEIPSESNA